MQPICTHKISIQSSKPSHAYPIIRLPRQFRELAGTSAEIYQTSYKDGIAFLVKVVDRSQKKLNKVSNSKTSPSHGGGRVFESPSAEASLMARVVLSTFHYSRNPALILKPEISDRQRAFELLLVRTILLLIDAIPYVILYLLGQYLSGLQTRSSVSVIASHTQS